MKKNNQLFITATLVLMAVISQYAEAQTAPPPAFGDETKGRPAVSETEKLAPPVQTQATPTGEVNTDANTQSLGDSLLGNATITESRRENGQLYRIELQHSSGSKQILEETDSDGQLKSDDNGLDDTPNLTKWQLGSW